VRFGVISANLMLLVGIGFFAVSAQSVDSPSKEPAKAQLVGGTSQSQPLDAISSADVAVHVARLTGLQEATAVVNKADTFNAELAVAGTDDQVVAKPQIVGAGLKSKKDIKQYTVVAGDTISSIAAKFGITADTVRNSNGLSGEAVAVGKVLIISPVNGMTYVVKPGDTPDAIANRYFSNKDQLVAFNDAEITGGFAVGETIVIPDAIQPTTTMNRAVGTAAFGGYGSSFAFGSAPVYSANGYDYGWCTWHAANRRREIGRPIPSNLGNAISWLSLARKAGLPTGNVPQDGAVVYHKSIGGLGHVAFVEKVNPDGSALFSDMNYPIWGKVTYRTVPASEMGNYAFIY
jgi:surface antigen